MNIKELRIKTGQTQKEFADSFGIPVGTLRRWEYGESTPAPYVLRMIAERLPAGTDPTKKIVSQGSTYYYDKICGTIADIKGTKIQINEDLDGVNEHNLAIYADRLFENYYMAVNQFDRACRLDKQEGITWG